MLIFFFSSRKLQRNQTHKKVVLPNPNLIRRPMHLAQNLKQQRPEMKPVVKCWKRENAKCEHNSKTNRTMTAFLFNSKNEWICYDDVITEKPIIHNEKWVPLEALKSVFYVYILKVLFTTQTGFSFSQKNMTKKDSFDFLYDVYY